MFKKSSIIVKSNLWAIAVAAPLFAGEVNAASFEYGGNGGIEHFQWREVDDDGREFLKESGTRNMVSGFIGNTKSADSHFIYRADAKIYFGSVHYDGETQEDPPVPVQSDTTYTGLNVEGGVGSRTGNANDPFAWDFIGRIGVDNWVREIAESNDINGRPVGSAREQYTILNLKIGTGPYWRKRRWQGRLIAGFKYPFATDEYISKDYTGFDRDVNLSPKGRLSPFLNFYNTIRLTHKLSMTIDAFYDSYRFDKSDSVAVINTSDGKRYGVYQPKSSQDNYGVQIGVAVSI